MLRSPGFEAYLLDQVQAAVTATDVTGAITHWNRGAETLFGWTRDEVMGRDFRELLVSASDAEAIDEIRAAVLSGQDREGEFPLQRKDGRLVLAYNTLSPIRAADDRVLGVVSVSMDIGERIRQERLLAARTAVTNALAEADSLAEAAPRVLEAICDKLGWQVGALWSVDDVAGVLRCADLWHTPSVSVPEFERVTRGKLFPLGIGLPGRVWSSARSAWIPDVTQDDNFPRAPYAAQEGIHSACGFPILLGNEVLGVLEFFSREIQEPDDSILLALSVIGSQIGQFMERKEAEERVREGRERLRLAVEAGRLGTWHYDLATKTVTWDETVERIFGAPPGSFSGTFEDYAVRLHPDERAWILATIDGARQSGSDFEFEHRILWPDGSLHWIQSRGACIMNYAGEVVAMTGVVTDITERRRVDQAQRFLAESAPLLAASITDYEETLRGVANLVVPELADWCSIDMLEPDGSIRQVVVAHVDPGKVRLAKELRARYPANPSAPAGVSKVLRTGQPEILADIPDSLLRDSAPDPEFLQIIRGLGLRSVLVVPMVARGRTLGAITLVTAESGRRYDEGDLLFAQEVARRAAFAVDNARLVQELREVATQLQQSLLPPELPEVEGMEIEGRYRWGGLGNEVGGDFYDVFDTGDGSWALTIGDVCGKGVEAAVVTSLARHTLRAVALQERKPSAILRNLNQAVRQQRTDHMFCTVCYVRLKPDDDGARLTVCSAGHPLPLVLRADGSVETAGAPGALLGIFPDPELTDVVVDLRHGDALVLFTDGILEERRRTGESFGRGRLASVLASCRGKDAGGIAEAIEGALAAFTPKAPRDDVALLVVKVKGGDSGRGGL